MDSTLKQLAAITHIHAGALNGVRQHYERISLLDIPVPILVGITGACENVATLFKVMGSQRIHLTQTGQLALEQTLQFSPGVSCITKSFRTDHIDERHLNEFTLIEEEIGCTHASIGIAKEDYDEDSMFEKLLEHITQAIHAIIANVLATSKEILGEMNAPVELLEAALSNQFPRITYTEAIKLLNDNTSTNSIEWGEDLKSKHELLLLELMAQRSKMPQLPVFVTHYPKSIKFFNMKEHEKNSEVVNSADLLLPYVGEAVGSAVREHDYNKLLQRLTNSTMFLHIQEQGLATLDDFLPYLQVIENGSTPPHAGYGIGLERVIQYMMGENDIRKCSVSYLLNQLMGFNKQLELMQSGSNAPGF